jgi:hypothetical protein
MTVKKFIAIASAAFAVSLSASAEVTVDYVTDYVFRGTLLAEDSIQPGFETTAFSDKVTVGTWANFDLDQSEFDEIDYYFSYSIPMKEDSKIGIDVGYTEYTYPTGEIDADREPFVSFGTTYEMVDLSLLVAYGVDGLIKDSLYIELGAGTGIDVAENIAVDLSAALGYADPDGGESGLSHLTLGASTDLAIPETDYSFTVGVTYIVETDGDVQEIAEELVFSVGTTL